MNKINKQLAGLLFISATILSPAAIIGAKDFGIMTLKLSGEVDLAKTPNPATPHYLSGALTGTLSMILPTAYHTATAQWSGAFSLVGISGSNASCASGISIFRPIPGTNKKGLELTYSANTAVKAYVIPSFNYIGMVLLDQSAGWTTNGSFFSPPQGSGAASFDDSYTCIYPGNLSVPSTWVKHVMISNPSSYPVYISRPVAPGLVHYTGTPLYITTEGIAEAAKGNLKVNISADINIMSTCQISNIINNNIDVTMGFSNEIIKESSLTFSCTGEGQQQVYFSAKVTEGTADTANPNRLLLTNITSPSVKNRPWVIGKTFMDDTSPALTCSDANTNDLIKFNNQEMTLPLKANLNQLYRLGIKWAICSDDTVPAGNYRGKTVINIYTKM